MVGSWWKSEGDSKFSLKNIFLISHMNQSAENQEYPK